MKCHLAISPPPESGGIHSYVPCLPPGYNIHKKSLLNAPKFNICLQSRGNDIAYVIGYCNTSVKQPNLQKDLVQSTLLLMYQGQGVHGFEPCFRVGAEETFEHEAKRMEAVWASLGWRPCSRLSPHRWALDKACHLLVSFSLPKCLLNPGITRF